MNLNITYKRMPWTDCDPQTQSRLKQLTNGNKGIMCDLPEIRQVTVIMALHNNDPIGWSTITQEGVIFLFVKEDYRQNRIGESLFVKSVAFTKEIGKDSIFIPTNFISNQLAKKHLPESFPAKPCSEVSLIIADIADYRQSIY